MAINTFSIDINDVAFELVAPDVSMPLFSLNMVTGEATTEWLPQDWMRVITNRALVLFNAISEAERKNGALTFLQRFVNASPLDDSVLGLTVFNAGDVYTLSVAIAAGTGPAHVVVNLPYGTGADGVSTGGGVAIVGGITTAGSGAVAMNGSVIGYSNANTIAPGAVTNAMIAPAAGIEQSKIADLTDDLAAIDTALAGKANADAVVLLTGNQSISGVKTFTSAPVVPSDAFPESAVAGLTTALSDINASLLTKANADTVVTLTGTQAISGEKTFTAALTNFKGAFGLWDGAAYSYGTAGQVLTSAGPGVPPVWAAGGGGGGSGTVTSVTLSTGTTGLLVNTNQTSQTITSSGTFTLAGTLAVGNGGTGATTLTQYGILLGGGTSAVSVSAPLTNGQLLIGSTGAAPVPATLTGTANRVNVTNSAGSITLSTPQDIATTSSPTFAGLTLSGTSISRITFTTNAELKTASDNAVRLYPNSGDTVFVYAEGRSSGTGAGIAIQAGFASGTATAGGLLRLYGGNASATNAAGGSVGIEGGAPGTGGTAGQINIGTRTVAPMASAIAIGHTGITTTIGGTLSLTNLNATADTITLAATAGAGLLTLKSASLLTIQPAESTLGSSYSLSLVGGDNNFASAGGTGGTVNITGGAGKGTNANGGNVNISGGVKTGTGSAGIVYIGNSANTSALRIGHSTNNTTLAGAVSFSNYIDNSNLFQYSTTSTLFAPYSKNYGDGSIYDFTVRGENNSAGDGGALKLSGGATTKTGSVGGNVFINGGSGTTPGIVIIGDTTATQEVRIGRAGSYNYLSGTTSSSGLIIAPNFYWQSSTTKYLSPVAANLATQPPSVSIQGESNTAGQGGDIYVLGGQTSNNTVGGDLYLRGGAASGGSFAQGGSVYIVGGSGYSGNRGSVEIGNTLGGLSLSGNAISITGNTSLLSGSLTLNTALAATSGGTGFDSYSVGALLYANTTTSLARLNPTTNGYVLTLVGGVPQWQPSGGGSGGVTSVQGTANQVLVNGTVATPTAGALTLTLAQSIGETSTPKFGGMTLGGALSITSGGIGINTGNVALADGTFSIRTTDRQMNLGMTGIVIYDMLGSPGSTTDFSITGAFQHLASARGGAINITGGASVDLDINGGPVYITGGAVSKNADGGEVVIAGGQSTLGAGGSVYVRAGNGPIKGDVFVGVTNTAEVTIGATGVTTTVVSPALTGTPTAPTAAASTSTTQIATTAFVQQKASSVEYQDSTTSALFSVSSSLLPVATVVIPNAVALNKKIAVVFTCSAQLVPNTPTPANFVFTIYTNNGSYAQKRTIIGHPTDNLTVGVSLSTVVSGVGLGSNDLTIEIQVSSNSSPLNGVMTIGANEANLTATVLN